MDAENISIDGCSQRDSAEHKGYVRAHRSFNRIWKDQQSTDVLKRSIEAVCIDSRCLHIHAILIFQGDF